MTSPTPGRDAARPPAMSDVAQLAGVSHQTVSRVLNDPDKVTPATRQRVRSAIAELGYRRNVAARALVTRRTGAIGVVIPATTLHGPTSTLLSLEHAARRVGLWVSLASLTTPDGPAMRDALEHFIDQGVDALVVIAPTAGVLDAVREERAALPIVTVTSGPGAGPGRVTVSVDQRLGARLATEHLIRLGHRRIGHIAGPSDWFDARERLAGWRDALAAAGLPEGPVAPGTWSAQSGHGCALRLLQPDAGAAAQPGGTRQTRPPRPTALFAANDQMALGALQALAEVGLEVPRQLSVVGFDDAPGSGSYRPPLTTVHQDFDELGRRALAAVQHALDPHGAPTPAGPIPPTLTVRASTAPPEDTA